jgi:alpha-ketoglutarate-dependent taurine dioxygenase
VTRKEGKAMPLSFRSLHPSIGAQVQGLDMREPLDEATAQRLRDAWVEHKVLVLHGQSITDDEHAAFSRLFGELEEHHQSIIKDRTNPAIFKVSNVDDDGNIRPPATDLTMKQLLSTKMWHTDSSFRENPAMGSILHGVEVVDEGGQTCFTNMEAVYEGLPADLKEKVEGRRCLHDFSYLSVISGGPKPTAEEMAKMPPIWQPMVRVHPVTGRKSLYISPIYNEKIEGMGDAEAKAVLDALYEIASEPRFVYEHRWAKDDVVMWDNRSTMHRILPYDPTRRRIMHRTTIVGDGPVIAA